MSMSVTSERKKPFVIAIANGKGGVGKTTTALAVGTILARRGLKVLCIDLDPQGNLTLALGYKPHSMPPAPGNLPTVGTLFARDTFPTQNENLDLVFARSLIVDNTYQIRVNTGDDLFFLGQDLSAIRTLPYDYVLIDCPPSIGKIISNALFSADFLIMPSQAEYFSINALKEMLGLIATVRQARNADLPFRILISLFDRSNSIHNTLKGLLRSMYGSSLFETVIETDDALYETAIRGFPADNSRGVAQYRKLVDELMDVVLGEH
jgi:chromosome partitioning protein